MTSVTDTWILVPVPAREAAQARLLDRAAVRGGLGLLAWANRPHRRAPRVVDLDRVERGSLAARPFC